MRENDCEERAGMKAVSVLKGGVDEAGQQQQQQQQRELISLNNSVDVYSVLLTKNVYNSTSLICYLFCMNLFAFMLVKSSREVA